MSKQKSPSIPDSKWIYFVYTWGQPIGVFTNGALAISLVKLVSKNLLKPVEKGAISVVRYRPAVDFYKFKEEDITESIMKFV